MSMILVTHSRMTQKKLDLERRLGFTCWEDDAGVSSYSVYIKRAMLKLIISKIEDEANRVHAYNVTAWGSLKKEKV